MLNITISNRYMPAVAETYYLSNVDIQDAAEVEYAIEEVIGAFMDTYGAKLMAFAPECKWEDLVDAIVYRAEEAEE